MAELLDARGVAIAAGDTVIYGFGVGQSVAMAEGVIEGEYPPPPDFPPGCTAAIVIQEEVSLTPSGRVRVKVVRRSYGGGSKPVVDIAPDRLVVLKTNSEWCPRPCLPPSPLPTQAEENRKRIQNLIEMYTDDLRATEVPDQYPYEGWDLAEFHAHAATRLAELRQELTKLDG